MTTARVHAARRAVHLLGGPVKAAKLLEIVNYQTVQSWEHNGVPAAHCARVERCLAGQMGRRELRPDDWAKYWPELDDASSLAGTLETQEQGSTFV